MRSTPLPFPQPLPTHAANVQEDYAEWKAERAQQGLDLPTIIYSSRTHSQLAQVMGELRTTSYRPSTAVLSSRNQARLHEAA
jgi:hypothetical protein